MLVVVVAVMGGCMMRMTDSLSIIIRLFACLIVVFCLRLSLSLSPTLSINSIAYFFPLSSRRFHFSIFSFY